MKAKVVLFWVLLGVSFVTCAFFFFLPREYAINIYMFGRMRSITTEVFNKLYDINGGIFSGAFLTMWIILIEYFHEKKRTFEGFYRTCQKVLSSIGKLPYFELDNVKGYEMHDEELALKCLRRYQQLSTINLGKYGKGLTGYKLEAKKERVMKFTKFEPNPFYSYKIRIENKTIRVTKQEKFDMYSKST